MKKLYFWCNIVTPHWLHTLSELSKILGVEVLVYADSLAQLEERKGFGWGAVGAFPGVSYRTKHLSLLPKIAELEKGYHLITNPFNDPFNKRLVSRLTQLGIPYGLQQSKPGLMSGWWGRFFRKLGYGLLFQRAMNSAQYILCHGEMCRSYLLQAGARKELLFLSGYYVQDTSLGLPARVPIEERRELRALYLGQFIDRKAVLSLAETARHRLRNLGLSLDFIGAGPQLEELLKIYQDGPGAVLPPVKYDQVLPTLRNYDILVLPSKADEWAVVVNEAIHSGCAIIVTENCGAADLVKHGGCGEVVSDASECVDALLRAALKPDIVTKWQRAADRLSSRITSSEGAKYLARIIIGAANAIGPEAIRPPWISESGKGTLHVAMIYHFFAHYRLPIIRELKRRDDIILDCYGDVSSLRIDASIKPITLAELPDLNVTRVSAWQQFLWQHGLLKAMWHSRADVFIFLASPYFVSTWITVLMLRLRGKKILYWGHLRFSASESLAKSLVRNVFYRLATGWLSYGHQGKAGLIASGVSSKAVHVIYNSLDYSSHLRLRNTRSATNKFIDDLAQEVKPTFICVSRLVPKRRLDMLFEAAALMAQKGRCVRLLLVGDGPLRQELEVSAGKLNLDARFYGACYDEQILRELYRHAIATVAPGEVGLTAIQSLSFGVPVITHNDFADQMPEAESVVHEVTGWLFAKNSVDGLLLAMESALDADIESMRPACFGMVDNFFNPRKQVQVIARASLGLPAMENDWTVFIDSIKNESNPSRPD